MNLLALLSAGSGHRSNITGGALIAVGVAGMLHPAQQIVMGDSPAISQEAWNLIQQAVPSLIGLAVIFIRSAIANVASPETAAKLAPFIQSVIEKAVQTALEKYRPAPEPPSDLIFSPPVRLED